MLKVGDKVKIVNNVDNNVEYYKFVKIGDIATITKFGVLTPAVELYCDSWKTKLYFELHQIESVEKVTQSEDLIIYKSRWDEIIEDLEGGYGMTDEEVEIVQSVLKNNTPFNVVEDPIIVDPVISKEEQTHLDATHVGNTGNSTFYYKSELLKKWFWWNDDNMWEECEFEYDNISQLLPIAISK